MLFGLSFCFPQEIGVGGGSFPMELCTKVQFSTGNGGKGGLFPMEKGLF